MIENLFFKMHKCHCEERRHGNPKVAVAKNKTASCLFGSPRHFVARDDNYLFL
jgi:hypothetical protein